ncbi:hypothetical protein [Haladaptatus sp. DYSN1]|uniref:hypothetical protein n=1 Tax=unclassified Haladaptatus TaxID=2622732 RepID=UPI002406C46B|nr:hypothetical protein [Haladaptatus sp. DYSN1]
MSRTCPDCDVAMESVEYDTDVNGDMIRIREGGGVLGKFGYKGATNVNAYLCPDCSRVLWYAE